MKDKLQELYEKMCKDCISEKRCHEQCEHCDEYEEEILKLEKEELKEYGKEKYKKIPTKIKIPKPNFNIDFELKDLYLETSTIVDKVQEKLSDYIKLIEIQNEKKIINEVNDVLVEHIYDSEVIVKAEQIVETFIKAVKYDEKEKAKRIDVWSDGKSKHYYCPSCKKRIGKYSYCKYCGQKLKGDEENE